MKMSEIRLLATDMDACFRFYQDVMGFPILWGAEGEGYILFKAGDAIGLALFRRNEMSQTVGTTKLPVDAASQDRTALVFGCDDLDATVKQLRDKGVQMLVEPQDRPDWGIRVAHFRDPDGNLIEINSPMPTTEWTEELRAEGEKYGVSD